MSVPESGFPGPGEWLMFLAVACYAVFLCAAVAIPWLAAHMKFWGGRGGMKTGLAVAALLARTGIFCLAGVVFFGLLSYHLATLSYAPGLLAVSMLLAPYLGAAPFLMAVWGGLFLICGKSGGRGKNEVMYFAASGLMALGLAAATVGLITAASDTSLWPQLRLNAGAVLASRSFLFGMAFTLFASATAGGILLMLIGRHAFQWERGESVAEGARLIRMGAIPSLAAALLMAVVVAAWLLAEGLGPLRALLFSADPLSLLMVVALAGGAVGMVELLVSILKWRGSAPRASAAVAALFLVMVFCVTVLLFRSASSPSLTRGQTTVRIVTAVVPEVR